MSRLFEPAGWMRDAACARLDPDLFFPGRGESSNEAKAVCAGCPVRDACLEYALAEGIVFGVWGGVAERERRRIRAQRRREQREAC